ncbi:MAG: potassium transporter, partial [Planctomycetota bacterium]
MQLAVIQRILGILLMIFSSTLLPPLFVGMYSADGAVQPFAEAFTLTLVLGFLLYFPVYNQRKELRLRDGFL